MMDFAAWWIWAKAQGPLGPVVLALAAAVLGMARYIVVLHREQATIAREAQAGMDSLMKLVLEKRDGHEKKDTRRIDQGEGAGSGGKNPGA